MYYYVDWHCMLLPKHLLGHAISRLASEQNAAEKSAAIINDQMKLAYTQENSCATCSECK